MSGGMRMECSKGKGSVRHDPRGVGGDALKERNLLEATEMGFLSSVFECEAT